jgi:hypothetical protein
MQPSDSMIDFSAPGRAVLSQKCLEHLQDLCRAHRTVLDQADHHPHILEYLRSPRGRTGRSNRNGGRLGCRLRAGTRPSSRIALRNRRARARLARGLADLGRDGLVCSRGLARRRRQGRGLTSAGAPWALLVEVDLLILTLWALVISDTSDRRLPPPVSFRAAKGATQVFPTAINGMSEEKDSAMPAPDQAPSREARERFGSS